MFRYNLLFLLLFLSQGGCDKEASDLKAGRTNVLVIVIDTLRADHLSCHGHSVLTTPHLDALAGEGVRFSSFFSTSPWTRPGIATLLTGLYPRSTGIYEEKFDALADDLLTLPERMQTRGYATLGVTANPNINKWFGFDQGFSAYGDSGILWPWMPKEGNQKAWKKGKRELETADSVTDRALAALDRHRKKGGAGKPFYLQVLYMDPHWPYTPPFELGVKMREAHSPTPDYDAEIHFVDTEVGRLLAGLDSRGLRGDTLIVVTSDHGEGLRDHPSVPLGETHGSILYDSVLRVPLIVAHPSLPRGKVVPQLTSSVSFLPTLLELLGMPGDSALPGISLAPLITGQIPLPDLPTQVFAETDWRINRKVAARSTSHLYIRNDDSRVFQGEGIFEGRVLTATDRRILTQIPREELYRGDGSPQDPRRNDVLEKSPEAVASLARAIREWEARTPSRPPLRRDPQDGETGSDGVFTPIPASSSSPAMSETLEAQLRALGYLGGEEEEGTAPPTGKASSP